MTTPIDKIIADGLHRAEVVDRRVSHDGLTVTMEYSLDAPLARALKVAVDGINKVIKEGVQVTDGPYEWKNNTCDHGRYGHEGCEECITEFLATMLAEMNRIAEGE